MSATILGGQARTSRSMRRYRFASCDTRAPWPFIAAGGANGSRFDSLGNIAAASAPRINYDEGVLVEAPCETLVQYPNDPGNAVWNQLGVTANANAFLSPRGLLEAYEVVLGGSANDRLDQGFPVAAVAGVTYNYAVWLYGVGSINIALNTTTGVGGGGEIAVNLLSEWRRHYVAATYDPGVTGNVRIHGVIDRAGGPSASQIYMWNPQVSLGPVPSSDVMSVTTPLTRTGDSLTCSDLAGLGWNDDEWTISVTLHEPAAVAGNYPMLMRLEGAGGSVININKQPDGQVEYAVYDGTSQYSLMLPGVTAGQATKYVMGCKRDQVLRVAAQGRGFAERTVGGAMPDQGLLRLGSANGYWHINQPIAEFAIAPRLLSAAEFIQEVES